MRTKILILFLAVAVWLPSAQAQINYAVSNNTAYVADSPNATGNISIAVTYEGYPVISISDYAFQNCTSLTNISIPDSVANIGEAAFNDCYNLTGVTIGNSVTNIGKGAFSGCAMTNVIIPASVTSIGLIAFAGCTSLTNIAVVSGNLAYSSTNGVLFNSNQTMLVGFPGGIVGSYTIPAGVTNIGDEAFFDCTGLKSVTIGNSVTSIGEDAFAVCISLTSVAIGNSVTSIGEEAFTSCTSLTSITVIAGNPAYSSLNGVLFNQNQTTLLQFPAGLSGSYTIPSSVTSIGDEAFYQCAKLTNIAIPTSITSIAEDAFAACSGLTSFTVVSGNPAYGSLNGVLFNQNQTTLLQFPAGLSGSYTIPGSVTNIGAQAFANCAKLTSVTIPTSVITINDSAFTFCYDLITVTIPNSVTSVGDNAFFDCTGLKSVTIGNSVTSIGVNTFRYSKLTSVTIPNSVTNIGNTAFEDCTSLTSITFLGNAPSLGNNVFDDVHAGATVYYYYGTSGWGATYGDLPTMELGLPFTYTLNNGAVAITGYIGSPTNIIIPATLNGYPVTSIGLNAFYGCTSLTSFTIPTSLTSVGAGAFFDCTNLSGVIIPNSVTNIGSQAFEYCSSVTNVTIGNSVTSIGSDAFYDCRNLTSVLIPDSVNNIGDYAFLDCTRLTSITVDSGNPVYSSVNGILFNKQQTALIQFPDGYVGNFTIPNNLTNIGDGAFAISPLIRFTIPNNVTSIGKNAFYDCYDLTSITIPNGVTSIGDTAFEDSALTNITFLGNAPSLGNNVFANVPVSATVYYHYGTSGWGATYGGLPTVELFAPPQIGNGNSSRVGVQSNGNFGFGITGVSGQTITIEASTNLVDWQVVQTIILSGTSTNFTDAQWKNHPNRYYRVR